MGKLDMARIGPSSGTSGEVLVHGWYRRMPKARKNDPRLSGRPDLTFMVRGILFAIFVDGRFWHDPKYAATKQRAHHRMDWVGKAFANRRRDWRVTRALSQSKVVVIRIWDDALRGKAVSVRTRIRIDNILLRSVPGDRWSVSREGVRRRGIYI